MGTEVQKVQPESGKGGGGRGGNGPTEADEAPVNYPRYYNLLPWGSDLHFVFIVTASILKYVQGCLSIAGGALWNLGKSAVFVL